MSSDFERLFISDIRKFEINRKSSTEISIKSSLFPSNGSFVYNKKRFNRQKNYITRSYFLTFQGSKNDKLPLIETFLEAMFWTELRSVTSEILFLTKTTRNRIRRLASHSDLSASERGVQITMSRKNSN